MAQALRLMQQKPESNMIFINYAVAVPQEQLLTAEFIKYFDEKVEIQQGRRTGSIRLYESLFRPIVGIYPRWRG